MDLGLLVGLWYMNEFGLIGRVIGIEFGLTDSVANTGRYRMNSFICHVQKINQKMAWSKPIASSVLYFTQRFVSVLFALAF
jgi:hypothetical protein